MAAGAARGQQCGDRPEPVRQRVRLILAWRLRQSSNASGQIVLNYQVKSVRRQKDYWLVSPRPLTVNCKFFLIVSDFYGIMRFRRANEKMVSWEEVPAMRTGKLVFVFLALVIAVLPSAEAGVFSDDFDDGEVDDWTVTTQGSGLFTASDSCSVSEPYSFYMSSPGNSQAKAVSPLYDVNLSENYHVSFYFLIPDTSNHWFEVFNNHQTYLVIDSGDDLEYYDGDTSYLVDELATGQWHHIEIKVYPSFEDYDVYVDEEFERSCPFWIHTGFENSFQIGDRENGSDDYGQAYWDDFEIIQPVDSDGDGIMDPNDNCPYVANPGQADRNSDGWGDVCECEAANCDGAGLITFLDFSILSAHWKENDLTLPGDINGDGVVDFNDLEILAYHWLSDCSEE